MITPSPDQDYLDLCINCSYQTVTHYPTFVEFVYALLSRIDEESYE